VQQPAPAARNVHKRAKGAQRADHARDDLALAQLTAALRAALAAASLATALALRVGAAPSQPAVVQERV
jgi:hypothetical protein